MVRRWKPQGVAFDAPMAWSRVCVHGHTDPDHLWLKVYSISFFHAGPSLHLQDLLHSVIISIVLVP